MTVSYVLNKRSKVLHRLPASESCNTDQIVDRERWEGSESETPVLINGERLGYCRRCFPDA